MIIDSPIISGSYLSTGSLSQTGNVSITGSLTATAGITGSFIDPIVEDYGMSVFFLIFTILPAFVGLLMILANKKIVTMMHGIE